MERRNLIVVEMARCLLKSKGVPGEFWGEAVTTAVYLLNCAPTRSLQGKTPYEAWYNRKPKVHHLRTFGCIAYVKQIGPGVSKLSDRSAPMVLMGYEAGTKGYRLYDSVARKLHISRDVIFAENRAWKWNQEVESGIGSTVFEVEHFTIARQGTVTDDAGSGSQSMTENSEDSVAEPLSPVQWSIDTDAVSPQATPSGSPHTPGVEYATPPTEDSMDSEGVQLRYRTMQNILDTSEEVQDFEYSGLCYLAGEEPHSIGDALGDKCWRDAMVIEMESIQANKHGSWLIYQKVIRP